MTERSRPWDGIVTGDASEAPYDAPTEWAAIWRSLSGAGAVPTNLGGVFRGELNELAVSGTTSPVSVATGRALAHGIWYESDAAENIVIATPGASTRIDRIVLRKDWSAQTVRITRIAGSEGAGAPSLVQTPGTTWDTPLAQVSITTGGTITVTDEREFIPYQQGFVRAGGNQAEQTTQSVTAIDLITISGLNIPVGTPVKVVANFKKVGATNAGRIGLKLNATSVQNTVIVTTTAATSGYVEWNFIYGRAGYLRAGQSLSHSVNEADHEGFTADMPTVPLTDIIILANVADAADELGVQDVQVYVGRTN